MTIPFSYKQMLKNEVQMLAREVDSPESSLGTLTANHLGECSRLTTQVKRCQAVVTHLDNMCQVE
ncbi:unnamed protein product [Choristocarpus tenellus]